MHGHRIHLASFLAVGIAAGLAPSRAAAFDSDFMEAIAPRRADHSLSIDAAVGFTAHTDERARWAVTPSVRARYQAPFALAASFDLAPVHVVVADTDRSGRVAALGVGQLSFDTQWFEAGLGVGFILDYAMLADTGAYDTYAISLLTGSLRVGVRDGLSLRLRGGIGIDAEPVIDDGLHEGGLSSALTLSGGLQIPVPIAGLRHTLEWGFDAGFLRTFEGSFFNQRLGSRLFVVGDGRAEHNLAITVSYQHSYLSMVGDTHGHGVLMGAEYRMGFAPDGEGDG